MQRFWGGQKRFLIAAGLICCLGIAALMMFHRRARSTGAPVSASPSAFEVRHDTINASLKTGSKAQSPPAPFLANVKAVVEAGDAIQEFGKWLEVFSESSVAERAAIESAGIALSRQRRNAMLELIKIDPERALRAAVPFQLRQNLPATIRTQLEERISGEGDLLVLGVTPGADPTAELRPIYHKVRIGPRSFDAHLYGRRSNYRTRFGIPLHGIAIEDVMAVADSPLRTLEPGEVPAADKIIAAETCPVSGVYIEPPADSTEPAVPLVESGNKIFAFCTASHIDAFEDRLWSEESGMAAAAIVNNIGPKRILIMRVDFPDTAGAIVSEQEAVSRMQEVDAFFRANSFQQMSIELVHVTPVLRLTRHSSYYVTNNFFDSLMVDARSLASQAGYPEEEYEFDIVTFPYVGFPWFGAGYVGEKGAFVQDRFDSSVIVHELGHNFGNHHANGWTTPDDSIIGPGVHEEYGNTFDPLGSSSLFPFGHYNANSKYLAGWLRDQHVQTVSTSGTYRIYAFDSGAPLQSGRHYAARVPAGFVLAGLAQDYWIDFRQQIVSNAWLMNGVVLKAATDSLNFFGSRILDMSPGSMGWFRDAPLLIGRTYSDHNRGIFITPLAKGTNGGLPFIDVRVNRSTAASAPPTLALEASATSARAGEMVYFTAVASDPDGDSLVYNWDFGDNGVDPASLNEPEVSKSWTNAAEYVVRCTVSDMRGGLTTDSIIVRVGEPYGYRMSGRVLVRGQPVQGARIQTYSPTFTSAHTDSDGTYTLTGLYPGNYAPEAFKAGYNLLPQFPMPVVIESNDVTGIDFSAVAKTGPFIISFTPATGAVGMAVTIRGTNFSQITNVMFGAVSAPFRIVSMTELSATVPEGAISGRIAVSGRIGSDTAATDFNVTATPPTITVQPQSQNIYIGSNATFVVKTSGSGPIAYQWSHQEVEIIGATNSVYSIFGIQSNHAGVYHVRVANPVGTNTSAPATLTVSPPISFGEALEAPDFVWSTTGTVSWFTQTNVTHDGIDAARTGGLVNANDYSLLEARVVGPGRLDFWWTMSAANCELHLLMDNSNRASIGGQHPWSRVSVYVPEGPRVLSWVLRALFPPGQPNRAVLDEVRFTQGEAPVITQQPQSQTVEEGQSAMFTVVASGPGPLGYLWRESGVGDLLSETNSSLFISNASSTRSFAVAVSNSIWTTFSDWVTLHVRPQMSPSVFLNSRWGTFLEQSDIELQVSGTDPDGTVKRVEVFHGTNLLGQADTWYMTLTLSNVPYGRYTFTARATDNSGRMSTSAPVRVTVAALIAKEAVWKYRDDGTSPAAAWCNPGFDDRLWSSGTAELGYGDSPATTIKFGPDAANKYITSYFRHSFVATSRPFTNLTLRVKRDDGAIVYLNGNEVFRSNLPDGPVGHLTRALRPIEGVEEEQFVTRGLDHNLLVDGTNVVAVEIHQSNPATEDARFDLALLGDLPWQPPRIELVLPSAGEIIFGPRVVIQPLVEDSDGHVTLVEFFSDEAKIGEARNPPFTFLWTNASAGYHHISATATDNKGLRGTPTEVERVEIEVNEALITFGSSWRYLDDGSDLQADWRSPDFNDGSWPSGDAEFGYGYESAVTPISFGNDPSNKFITTYFRHTFDLSDPSTISNATIRLRCDDGAIVYLNGTEVFRENLPPGEITSRTLALTAVEGTAAGTYVQRGIDPSLLQPGRNTIVVEVHQDSPSSPDLLFDLALGVNLRPTWPTIEITAPSRFLPAEGPTILLEAEASDRDGHVALMEWFANGRKIGESMGPPFTLLWSNVPACQFEILVNAIDNNGLVSSDSILLEVISPPRIKTLIPWRSFWRYLDTGTEQGSAWRHPDFDDAHWPVGETGFGFGDEDAGDYNTPINRVVTAFFRHYFQVTDPATYTNLVVIFQPRSGAGLPPSAEGAVAYLNGLEIFRARLPPGEVSSSTYAGDFGISSNENAIAALRAGINVLAVEFHQANPIAEWSEFALELKAGRSGDLPVLQPCFDIRRFWDESVRITWGDADKWFLEAADDPLGPWSHYSDSNPADYYFYSSPTRKFFRLHRR